MTDRPTRVKDEYGRPDKVQVYYQGQGGVCEHVWAAVWPAPKDEHGRTHTWYWYESGEEAIADTVERLKALGQ